MAPNFPKWFQRHILRHERDEEEKTLLEQQQIGEPTRIIIQADRPIKKIAEDRFDRAPFARQVAHVVATRVDPSSLVVGLYGPWGDGKTSTLSMIKETLATNPDVIAIDYNPWFYGANTEAITRSFFLSIGQALKKSGFFSKENIGDLLSKFGKAIPKVGDAAVAIGEAMTTESLTATRDRVSEILIKHKKKVVVFIDDIDRLDRREIQTLFKLVRLSGDFSHTTYILAFDDGVVAEALGEAYGSGDAVAGRNFLEKIVQVPLHLPPANPETLRKLVFESCERVLRDNEIQLQHGQNNEIANGLVGVFADALKTPRQAKLYDNAISFAVPILKGEVRITDQMMIEAIRIFFPKLYTAIRDNQAAFLERDRNQRHDAENPIVKAALASSGLPEEGQKRLKHLAIEKLFPRTASMGYGDEWNVIWSREKRICAKDYFGRYFNYGVPTGDISDLTLDEIVAAARHADVGAVASLFGHVIERQSLDSLILKLRRREETIPAAAIPTLTMTLAAKSDHIRVTNEIMAGDWSQTQAAILVAHLVKNLPEDRHEELLAAVLEASASEPFSVQVLKWCRFYEKDGQTRGFLPLDIHDRLLASVWRSFVSAMGERSIFEFGARLSPFLFYIVHWGGDTLKTELREYINMKTASSPDDALLLLRMVAGESWAMDSGIPSVQPFDRRAYDSLGALVDTPLIYDQLLGRFGSELGVTSFEETYADREDVDIDRRLARQFAYMHRHPEEAAKDANGEVAAVVDNIDADSPDDQSSE